MKDLYILKKTTRHMTETSKIKERFKVFFNPFLFDKVSAFVIKEDRKLLEELAKH